MSFHVGQRVRLRNIPQNAITKDGRAAIGATGTVLGQCCPPHDKLGLPAVSVDFDDFPPAAGWPGWRIGCWRLEPAYDGNQPVSWNQCSWRPDPHRVVSLPNLGPPLK